MLFFKKLGDTYIINKTNLMFSLTFRNNTYSVDTWDWKNVAGTLLQYQRYCGKLKATHPPLFAERKSSPLN